MDDRTNATIEHQLRRFKRYLIQHSAGSGKSFTIAWLAHQLSTLHDTSNRRVFDSIVVITDRRTRQL
jgi:type I site-specific restriction-modification system R (restriction) subunit